MASVVAAVAGWAAVVAEVMQACQTPLALSRMLHWVAPVAVQAESAGLVELADARPYPLVAQPVPVGARPSPPGGRPDQPVAQPARRVAQPAPREVPLVPMAARPVPMGARRVLAEPQARAVRRAQAASSERVELWEPEERP